MSTIWRLCLLVGLATAFSLGSVGIAQAGPDNAQHGGSLDAWKMTAHVFKDGNSTDAQVAVSHHCYDIHLFIDAWYEDQGIEFGSHYEWWLDKAQDLKTWMALNPEIVQELIDDYAITTDFANNDTLWCTNTHEDGWKVATDSIVDLTDNDDEIQLISITGETVVCSYGDVMMASATYYYNYWSGVRDNHPAAFSSGFGTNWNDLPGGGVLFSSDIEFRCLDIFDPGVDIAEVTEAVPTTQVNANPATKGLTGLDMWLWYEFNSAADATLGPFDGDTPINAHGETWTVTAYAWIDQVQWDVDCTSACDFRGMAASFDDSGYEFTLDFADTAAQPADVYFGGIEADGEAAYEHIYDELGNYTLSTAAQWRGWYFVTSSDGDVGPLNYYDPVVVAESVSFPVVSVRTELRTGP